MRISHPVIKKATWAFTQTKYWTIKYWTFTKKEKLWRVGTTTKGLHTPILCTSEPQYFLAYFWSNRYQFSYFIVYIHHEIFFIDFLKKLIREKTQFTSSRGFTHMHCSDIDDSIELLIQYSLEMCCKYLHCM